MKQEELKVGLEVWSKGVDIVRGKITEVCNNPITKYSGCFVLVDYDPSGYLMGLNIYCECEEVVLYNPNESPPESYKDPYE